MIEPPGKRRREEVERVRRRARSCPVTVVTRCWTAAVRSRRRSRGTRTEPGSQTRPRSLRSTSTIITFSAWSFALGEQLAGERAVLLAGRGRAAACP